MQAPYDTPLVATDSCLDRPAVFAATCTWTWRQIHAAALEMAAQLGDASAVCNLCTSRVSFLVTWLAALRSGRLLILPPSGGPADLAAVLATSARTLQVVDDAQALDAAQAHGAALLCRPEWSASTASSAALAWRPAWDETAVLLYTSGSTGTPQAQPKTLRQLAIGAQVLGARLAEEVAGGLAAIERVVCSVPPQHMFGVEGSVMLSLVHGMPVHDGRPLLPADVRDAFAAGPPALWVATPLHLRSLVLAGEALTGCRAVLASTMPLAQALARDAQALAAAPVLEIYGSTETGVLAMRRSATEASWRPVDGVRLVSAGDETQAFGDHFESPSRLLDRIEPGGDGRFTLLGRQADLIKIAGRRASLAGLNLLLQDLPGLADGVFYLPASGSPTERLCLIYVGKPLDPAATRRWLRERLDPVFLPRTLIQVERLPRSDNGKLPRQALDRLYQAWRAAAPHRFAVAENHPALAGHFPGQPIVPGVLLLDHVLSHLGATLQRPVVQLQQVKFALPLRPAEVVQLDFDVTGSRVRFSVTATRNGSAACLATGVARLAEPAAAVP